jgi:FkbM family methyltransferase
MSSSFAEWVEDFKLDCGPTIHVGAHYAQERQVYEDLDCTPVLWFEANPESVKIALENLANFPNQKMVSKALWSQRGEIRTLFLAGSETSSSSLLEPYLISASHPEVRRISELTIETSTLDWELQNLRSTTIYRTLVLDVQGAELEVLKGAVKTLESIKYIVSEVSNLELYRDSARMTELVHFLESKGFSFIASNLDRSTGWGDGLFARTNALNNQKALKRKHVTKGKYFAKGRLWRTLQIKLHRSN